MYILFVIIHVIVCIALILIVLLQTGKGAEMGAAFGGASQTIFGGAGPAPFLTKITTGAAIIFMITSLLLAYMSARPSSSSIMKDVKPIPTSRPGAMPAGNVAAVPDKSAKPAAPVPTAPDAKPVPAQQPAGNAPIQQTPVPEAAKK
jgi:preprotein translocase subunit SecG